MAIYGKFALGLWCVSEMSEWLNSTFGFHTCQVSMNRRHQSDILN